MGVVVNKIISQKHIFAEKKLKKKIAELALQESWLYYRPKPQKKIELALKIRYEDQYFRLHKWIDTKKGFLNLSKTIRFIRVMEKNRSDGNKKVTELKCKRFYTLKLQCVTTNSARINFGVESILALKILSSKEQVISEFKRKSVLNSQGAPGIVRLKTILSDTAILC